MNDMETSPAHGNNSPHGKTYHRLTAGKVIRIVGWVISGIVLACFLAIIFGLLVKWLWGVTLTPLFNLPQPTYWQAVGLILLAKLLFGGIGHHHNNRFHPHRHERWHDRDDSHSTKGRSPFDHAFFGAPHGRHYRKFWEQEGKQAFADYLDKQRSKPGA
jgi:hypothetical protein